MGDPVGDGFAASLAQPGGNITGLTNEGAEISLAGYVAATGPQARDNRRWRVLMLATLFLVHQSPERRNT